MLLALRNGQGAPEDMAMKIKNTIGDKCGLLCSIGVTSTKSSAKIASDYNKPDGLTVVYIHITWPSFWSH